MAKVLTQVIGYFKVKPRVRVPKLEVWRGGQREIYALVADRYVIGRNPKECDIVLVTPLISQVHAELVRDRRQSDRFYIRDQDSTNGIYRQKGLGRQRIKSAPLRHNTRISLGPPELKEAITLRFIDPPPWYVQLLGWLGKGVLVLFLGLVLAIAWEWQKFSVKPLPPVEQGPIEVLAGDGTSISPADRIPHTELERLEDFGELLPKAVVISEDRTFYWNIGIDPIGIARAVVTNVRTRQLREGASTITQQLARNTLRSYVGTGDSPGRKWREMVAALKITATYSKREILTFYLNRVYLGYGVYGFRDAALFYFGKEPSQLSLSEAATLAGILPAPERINPFRNKQLALEYRDRVLQRLANAKLVKAEEAERARRSVLKLNTESLKNSQGTLAPYFYGYIMEELTELLGENFAREGNLIVATDLNLAWQREADRSLQEFVALAGPAYNFSQGAILTIDTTKGSILAMTGGVDFRQSQFNRASHAQRQPGSTFKLFAYAAALEGGISPSQTFDCSPLGGVSGCRSGAGGLDMYTAFALSENVVAIRVGESIGLDRVVKLARQMGIRSPLQPDGNMVLGGYEVTMPEMAAAYATVDRGGKYLPVHGIVKIWDSADCQDRKQISTCRLIYEAETGGSAVLSTATVDILHQMMALVVSQGTGRAAAIPQGQVIGKTGTTDDSRDLWFIGIVPDRHILTAVWLGNDEGVTNGSSSLAAQLWGEYMAKVL
ncbi:MAG: transglycosylase domain-containing protein [Pseudanabaenaceae cyanobacterium SKYGB_i_bin29]|nr:transglycosylase domain-containing protein [Pseudanabaenaceae cyanobacterium SKYG29]MDW8421766.1 transglycosylase domain-containing protein [Pseudanabaenaceae cyanobacterium SKYGB_i_bin29]